MSNYPGELDDDSTLPSVIDGSTETGADAINALRTAVLAVEAAIGADPQGSLASLVQRIAVSLNDDGTIKSSALLAAGLIALPITNSQISASAAVAESKLDLDYATTALYNAIVSNDIDISALQDAVLGLLGDFAQHVTGDNFNHDGFGINLDNNNPGTPPWLTGFTASTVSDALAAIVASYNTHTAAGTVGAHLASNISVSALSTLSATNVQDALEQLEDYRAAELVSHRDELHANGISNWENDTAGWNTRLQRSPSTGTTSALAITESILDLSPEDLSAAGVQIGDVFVIAGDGYTVTRTGPSSGFGSILSLTASQVEIAGGLTEGQTYDAAIFAKASVSNLRVALATTLIPGNSTVDSVLFARPNAAKLVTLGIYPEMISSTDSITVEVGTGGGATRSVTITSLERDRTGATPVTVTLRSICDRINYVVGGAAEGNFVPFAAYVIGGEIALVHNWSDSADYTIECTSAAGEIERALDNAGMMALTVTPTVSNVFWVDGEQHRDFRAQFSGSATFSGATISAPAVDFSALPVTAGQIVHILTSNIAAEVGSYPITAVGSSTFSIDAVLTGTAGTIRIDGGSLGLAEFDGATNASIVELFVNREGRTARNIRATYNDTISGVKIIGVGDSLRAGTNPLTVSADGANRVFRFSANASQAPQTVADTFVGRLQLYSSTNVDWAEVETTNPVGTGTTSVTVFEHIDEEDLFELSQIRIAGRTVEVISDRRLFGSTGLDEVREDVVQAYVETPLAELRGNGAVRGFSVLEDDVDMQALQGYAAGVRGLLVDGGIAYVGGVRVVQSTQYVPIPAIDGTYTVGITGNSSYSTLDAAVYSLTDILEGRAGAFLSIASVVRGPGAVIESTSLVTYISDIDSRVDAVLDLTNNFTGSFASMSAAVAYLNNYPDNEKRKLRIVSTSDSSVDLSDLTAELDVQIEGAVSTVSSSQNVRLTGTTIAGRTSPHITALNFSATSGVFKDLILQDVSIDPALVSGASYVFDNCTFIDSVFDLQDPSGNVSDIRFSNCRFSGTMTFAITSSLVGSNRMVFEDCDSTAVGEFALQGVEARFDKCRFTTSTITWQGAPESTVNLYDVEFLGHTIGLGESVYAALSGRTNIRGLYVDDLTITDVTSAFDLDAFQLNTCYNIFANVLVTHATSSSTPYFINGGELTTVRDVRFFGGAFISVNVPAVSANDISFFESDPQGALPTRLDANFVSECRNIRLIRPLQALYPLVVSSTRFVGTPLAPCVAWSDDLSVSDCDFDVSISGIGIGAADPTSRAGISVSNSRFESGSGNSLDFGSILSLDAYLTDCRFGTALVPNSALLSGIKIFNSVFSVSSEISLAADCTVADCTFAQELELTGAYSDLIVSGCRGPIALTGSSTTSYLANHTGDVRFEGTHSSFSLVDSEVEFVSNVAGATFNSSTFSKVGIQIGSIFAYTTYNSHKFDVCRFDAVSIVPAAFGGAVDVFDCIFAQSLTFAGTPTAFYVRNNRSLSAAGEMVFSVPVAGSKIVSNTGFSLDFADSVTNSVISQNSDDDFVTFDGALFSNCQFSENNFSSVVINAIQISDISISSNYVNDMTIGSTQTTTCERVSVNNLIAAQEVAVMANPASAGAVSYSNVVLSDIHTTTIYLGQVVSAPSSTLADITFTNCHCSLLDIFPDGASGTPTNNVRVNGGRVTSIEYEGVVRTANDLSDDGVYLSFVSNSNVAVPAYGLIAADGGITRSTAGALNIGNSANVTGLNIGTSLSSGAILIGRENGNSISINNPSLNRNIAYSGYYQDLAVVDADNHGVVVTRYQTLGSPSATRAILDRVFLDGTATGLISFEYTISVHDPSTDWTYFAKGLAHYNEASTSLPAVSDRILGTRISNAGVKSIDPGSNYPEVGLESFVDGFGTWVTLQVSIDTAINFTSNCLVWSTVSHVALRG